MNLDDLYEDATENQLANAPAMGDTVKVMNAYVERLQPGVIVDSPRHHQPIPGTFCVRLEHRVEMVHDWQDDHGDLMHKVLPL